VIDVARISNLLIMMIVDGYENRLAHEPRRPATTLGRLDATLGVGGDGRLRRVEGRRPRRKRRSSWSLLAEPQRPASTGLRNSRAQPSPRLANAEPLWSRLVWERSGRLQRLPTRRGSWPPFQDARASSSGRPNRSVGSTHKWPRAADRTTVTAHGCTTAPRSIPVYQLWQSDLIGPEHVSVDTSRSVVADQTSLYGNALPVAQGHQTRCGVVFD